MVLHFLPAVLVLIYSFQLIAGASRRRRLPPGPWPLPIIGSLAALSRSRGQPHRSLARLAERHHGGLMTIWFGPFPIVVVSTPAAARDILARHNADLAGRTVLDAWRAEGHASRSVLFHPPGYRWREMRRLASSEMFARLQLDARRPQRQEKARELVRHVSRRGPQGLRCHVKEAVRLAAMPTASDLFPAMAAADVQGVRRRMGVQMRAVYRIIDEQFSGRRRDAGEPRKDDLMDVTIDKEDEDGSQLSYNPRTDSVSSTVEWAMAELLRHPEAMSKAQEELRAAMGTKPEVEESDIAQLPYLQAVVKEALRLLHPPATMSFYRAMATAEVGGDTIPKGTSVVLNIWAVHRRADVWADPDKFMPERFVGNEMSLWGKSFELIPFGAGRRVCLGLPLAYRMVHLMLASLLYHFDWTLPEGGGIDISERFGVVVSMATPLKAVAKKRDL